MLLVEEMHLVHTRVHGSPRLMQDCADVRG